MPRRSPYGTSCRPAGPSQSRGAGPVFKLDRADGKPGRLAVDRVSKTVSSIGEKAKVRVDVKKTASAFDLRRALGEHWAARVDARQTDGVDAARDDRNDSLVLRRPQRRENGRHPLARAREGDGAGAESGLTKAEGETRKSGRVKGQKTAAPNSRPFQGVTVRGPPDRAPALSSRFLEYRRRDLNPHVLSDNGF